MKPMHGAVLCQRHPQSAIGRIQDTRYRGPRKTNLTRFRRVAEDPRIAVHPSKSKPRYWVQTRRLRVACLGWGALVLLRVPSPAEGAALAWTAEGGMRWAAVEPSGPSKTGFT